jgi:ceramide glucosyltransferase
VLAIAVLFAILFTVLSIGSLYRRTHRDRRAATTSRGAARALPPVSVLKPLCGADDRLEDNLATFFAQRYPRFEIIFGVEGESDPAIPVVRRLRARFPAVKTRLVVHDGGRALNPKVSNLQAMLAFGSHDMVAISDSNVAVGETWLADLVGELAEDPEVGLITNLFVGTSEETLGATLENLHLAGPVAGSLAVSAVLMPNAGAVGKSMLFSRSLFESLGGFASVGSVLAEDYVMGRMFSEAGYRVKIARTTVDNVVTRTSVKRFLARQLRWNLIRSRVMPLSYPLEPLSSPMLLAVIAPFAGYHAPVLFALGVCLTLARDGLQWLRLRGRKGMMAALPLGPIKEIAMLGVWAIAPFMSRVAWRGKRYRVASGTRLYAERSLRAPARLESE